MPYTLITGATGLIGRALCTSLDQDTPPLAISRGQLDLNTASVQGDFARFEDLRQLDRYEIEAVVHLGAVTGGCSERDGFAVNVEGTRCLMRYLIDRGCRRFVLASSIAVVGLQSAEFRPRRFPIPDEHPCFDRHGYGLSKYLMEELARYYHRQNPLLDITNLRLAAIHSDDAPPPWNHGDTPGEWALAGLTRMNLSDAVAAIRAALDISKPGQQPGFRVLNAAAPHAWADRPTAEILRAWYGPEVDLTWFEQPGHERRGAFDVRSIENELGFTATHTPMPPLQHDHVAR
ncbi:NAD-dependent epimerase/dehydratase family protein [Phycisphaerales bacterium AB-hyl4]|uniref:NAD-dependent epimerase/dehydratase family protein n=1 Tax=Natronomicrosphaera hydrolytica TaxID=3242702 RepID=A0ABV4UCK5_9BACT